MTEIRGWTHDYLLDEFGAILVDEFGAPLWSTLLAYAVMLELAGAGAGWTNVTRDVRADSPITFKYGIQGAGPKDRIADTGELHFELDNSENNSAGLLGYYAPGHANCRAGFDIGIAVRVEVSYAGIVYYKFAGTLEEATPEPGQYGARVTHCTGVDWMDEAASAKLSLLPVQTAKRGDEIIPIILAGMTRQPVSTELAVGQSVFPYIFDNSRDEASTPVREFQKIADSEMGYIYVKGDLSGASRLVFEDRHARPKNTTPAAILNNTMIELSASRKRSNVLNHFTMTVYPREVGTSNIVLWNMQSTPQVAPGESMVVTAYYRDPGQRAARTGALSLVAPVATTDYTMNEAQNGSGADLTANFVVTATTGGNSATLTVTNNGAVPGYVTLLQLRGVGLFAYEPLSKTAEDAASKTAHGLHAVNYDMPEQDDLQVADDLGEYLLAQWKNPTTLIDRVGFIANTSDALMLAGVAREPGERITVQEAATGVDQDFFINGVSLSISAPDVIAVDFQVQPADYHHYWVLDVSLLGTDTLLGY